MNKKPAQTTRIITAPDHATGRRRLLQALTLAGGAAASTTLPERWTRPVTDSVLLPAHAQTSADAFFYTCSIGEFQVPFSAEKTGSESEIAGIYTGTQEQAGPFFGDCRETGVGFPEQDLRIEIVPITQNRSPVNAGVRNASHGDQYEVRYFLNNVLIMTFIVLIVIGTIFLFERIRQLTFNGFPAQEIATYQFIINVGTNLLTISGFLRATLQVNEAAGP